MISQVGAAALWLEVVRQAVEDAECPLVYWGGRKGDGAASVAALQADARAFLQDVRSNLGETRSVEGGSRGTPSVYDIAEAADAALRHRMRSGHHA